MYFESHQDLQIFCIFEHTQILYTRITTIKYTFGLYSVESNPLYSRLI